MDFEVENQKILEKIRFKSNVFFDCIFLWILGGFGEGFGRGLEALGVSWVTFWRHFLKLVFRTLSKRALGGFWAPFELHFEGSGRGLGMILGGF